MYTILKKGQYFQINSFDFGFTNIEPVELTVKVVDLDYVENDIILEPELPPGDNIKNAFLAINRWFREEYPGIMKGALFVNNLTAFAKLVELGIATEGHTTG